MERLTDLLLGGTQLLGEETSHFLQGKGVGGEGKKGDSQVADASA